ncbi:Two-pore potassium channel 3 [Forsythia ovata]|uniref:Two-pore potassium channel 3 n=1 Tax=Forsythia ovata TaxID=205694 RepID=A0ABD1X0Y3_9LAMI
MEKEPLLPYVSPRRPQPSPPPPLSLCPLPENNEITIPPLIPICEFHLLQNQRSDPKKPDPKKTRIKRTTTILLRRVTGAIWGRTATSYWNTKVQHIRRWC